MIGGGMDPLGLALEIVVEGVVEDVIDSDYTIWSIKYNVFIGWKWCMCSFLSLEGRNQGVDGHILGGVGMLRWQAEGKLYSHCPMEGKALIGQTADAEKWSKGTWVAYDTDACIGPEFGGRSWNPYENESQ